MFSEARSSLYVLDHAELSIPLRIGTHLWYTFTVHQVHKLLKLLEQQVRVERPPGSTISLII